jgi:hypothetical protein
MPQKRQVIYYQLVTELSQDGTPSAYCHVMFTQRGTAEQYWKDNFQKRKKNDGFDEYWNNLPLMVQKVEKTITMYWLK